MNGEPRTGPYSGEGDEVSQGGARMNHTHNNIPSLQATAAMLLPGMKQARSLLDVSIRVLEYFETHAVSYAANGTATTLRVDPKLVRDAAQVRALLTAFDRLTESTN